MKKKFVILTLVLSLCAAGCSNNKSETKDQVTPTQAAGMSEEQATPTQAAESSEDTTLTKDTASTENEASAEAETAKNDQTAELSGLLDELKQHVQIGTAGSSLVQAKYAAKLLDWAMTTLLTQEEVKDAASAWIQAIKSDDLAEVQEQFHAVDGAFEELKKDNAQDLLETAGCEDTAYPWNDAAKGIMDAIMTSILGDARE